MKAKDTSLNALLEDLANGINRVVTRPDANSYKPHPKQDKFHQSGAKGRLYIGGNRSGKTVGGIIEDIWWLTNTHPFLETPTPPVRGRLVCVDFPNGFEKIVKPVLMQWIPPSCLINGSWTESYNARTRTLTLANGSFMEFMSYDQELDAFAGASRHFTHFDEEPPKAIWTECKARLIDTGGHWWITMTPVEGMSWVYDDIFEPFEQNGLQNKTDVIEVDMLENTYLSPIEAEDFLDGLDEDERKARKSGKFVQIGGLVFKTFHPQNHVISSLRGKPIPPKWRVVASLDHGYNNPTAWLYHAIAPNGTVITFREHYRAEWTIAQHVGAIKQIEAEIERRPEFYTGDPAIRQRSGINGNSILLEYSLRGIPVKPSNNDVKVGLARMLGYIDAGRWFITEDCPKLLWEIRRYKWKTRDSRKMQEKHGNFDEPTKKDDHAIDSARYFFVSLPVMEKPEIPPDYRRIKNEIQQMLKGVIGFDVTTGVTDWRLAADRERLSRLPTGNRYGDNFTGQMESKISTDEHMGGEW